MVCPIIPPKNDLIPELYPFIFDPLVLMDKKERKINVYLWLLMPFGISVILGALIGFPYTRLDAKLVILSLVTIFLSSFLRIQLPRNNVHLTISDALVMMSMLIYGGEVAVILAICETAFTSIHFRSKGVTIKLRTIIFNMLIAGIVAFAASRLVLMLFGANDQAYGDLELTSFIGLLALVALSMFAVNTVLVTPFLMIKGEKNFLTVVKEYYLDVLVLHLIGAVMAGLMLRAIQQINFLLFAGVIGFFALIYWTYRRNVDDVKRTSASAKQAEQLRAEQAERHVIELEHYVAELEKSGSALRESRELFRHAAYHDALTGLANRTQILDRLRGFIDAVTPSSNTKFAILFLDLNRFKTINDSLGHSSGDLLIKQVARRLKKMVKEDDMLGRFSGDEFAILLTGFEDDDEVTALAGKIAKRLADAFRVNGSKVFTSVSIGIAFGNDDYGEAEEVLRDADIAMYYAKENQKEFVIFDQRMHARAVSRLQLETDLRYAVVRNELELHYQPIVDLASAKLTGFEALVRWNHPTRGQIPPYEFIPVSEDTGIIIPMTLQILRTACLQLVDWQRRYTSDLPLTMSVNLSGKHFAQPDMVKDIKTILRETKITPGCLKLEITESAVMENAENAIAMLKQIRETGVQLSIDDFGTGHSSLSYLQRFPVDTLKVDRSFVSSMEDGSENGEIVRTVVALAKILKLNVVAEGIETVDQFHQLRVLGCEYGQGYLFSRPVPKAEAENLLSGTSAWEKIMANAEMPEPMRPHVQEIATISVTQ